MCILGNLVTYNFLVMIEVFKKDVNVIVHWSIFKRLSSTFSKHLLLELEATNLQSRDQDECCVFCKLVYIFLVFMLLFSF